ncbi:hypothetical protein D3C78_1702410 [compost metagenome]
MQLLEHAYLDRQFLFLPDDLLLCPFPGEVAAAVVGENALQLLELEAQLLGALDELQDIDVFLIVDPILPLARRLGKQAYLLVVTNALDGCSR